MTLLHELNFYVHFCNCNPLNQITIQLQALIGTTVVFLSMRIANNVKKVTDAVNASNKHAIVSKVVADL